jgi:uncharacterized protein HemX
LVAAGFSFKQFYANRNGDTTLADFEDEATTTEHAATETQGKAEAAPRNAKSGKTTAPKQRRGSWLGYSILILILIMAGGGFFLLHELRTKQEGLGSGLDKGDKQIQDLLHQISGLQTELAAVHSEVATLQSRINTEDSKFEREIAEQSTNIGERIESTQDNLSGAIDHIQQQMNLTRGDMMVADAEYLLSIANQKLHLVGDVKSVLSAMEAADQRLRDSGDPAVFRVREALAEEINALKKVEPVDSVGVSAKLLVIESKVGDIPLFLPHSNRINEDHAPAAGTNKPAGGNLLDTTLDNLKGLVTIRRTDRSIQAILLPEEVEALRQVLLLKLEMARSALLRNDETAYKSSLDSALGWLQEHFDPDAAITQGVTDEIKQLKELQIQVPFPDISKSLTLLRNTGKLRLEAEKNQGQPKTVAKSTDTHVTQQPAAPVETTAPPAPAPGAEGGKP